MVIKCPKCSWPLEKLNSKYETTEGEEFEFLHCFFCGKDFYGEVSLNAATLKDKLYCLLKLPQFPVGNYKTEE